MEDYELLPFSSVCTMRSAVRPSQRSGRVVCFHSPCSSLSSEAERAKEFSPTSSLVPMRQVGWMLGIGIEGDAGDVEEGSFFGDVSRVGDDAPCLVDEESEVQVTLRRQDVQVGSIHFQRLHRLFARRGVAGRR